MLDPTWHADRRRRDYIRSDMQYNSQSCRGSIAEFISGMGYGRLPHSRDSVLPTPLSIGATPEEGLCFDSALDISY